MKSKFENPCPFRDLLELTKAQSTYDFSFLISAQPYVYGDGYKSELQGEGVDEWEGRRAALASGLKVTGVLGLLGKAKSVGITQEIKPIVEKALRSGVRNHPDLVRRVPAMVKE